MTFAPESPVAAENDALRSEHSRTLERHAALAPLREEILAELNGQNRTAFSTTPTRLGNWWYFIRSVDGRDRAITYRVPIQERDKWRPPTPTEIEAMPDLESVIDDDAESRNARFYARSFTEISRDGSMVAFTVDRTDDENHELRVRKVGDSAEAAEVLEDVWPAFAFNHDASAIFYVTTDSAGRPNCVWKHLLGAERRDDELVHSEFDQRFWIDVSKTRSGRFLRISANAHHSTECHLIDLEDPDSRPAPVWPRRDGLRYEVEHVQDHPDRTRLLISVSDVDGTERIVLADAKSPQDASQHSLIRLSDPDATLVTVQPFRRHLAVAYRQDGYARVGVVKLTDLPRRDAHSSVVITPTAVTPIADPSTVYLGDNLDWLTPYVRVRATSFVNPIREYEYDPTNSVTRLLPAQTVTPLQGNCGQIEERIWATASDGVKIPVSLVTPLNWDAPAPFVVYGYGAYGVPSDPVYSSELQSLLKRGIGFAIVHVRGGGEFGAHWHQGGRLENKEQSFDDFVTGARALVEQGWAASGRLVAEGHSAGGLLVGAVANRWPELFRGIVAVSPFVDPLATLEDPSQPLTASDWEEFGNPLTTPEMREIIGRYSPVQNVRRQVYPRVLIEVGAMDNRVSPGESLRWAVALRRVGAQVDVLVHEAAGHTGPTGGEGRSALAFQYAWVIQTLK